MRERKTFRRLITVLLFILTAIVPAARAQDKAFRIDYTVAIANQEQHLFHVTADVQNIHEDQLSLQLPTWAPGWYTVENYAKNILRFAVTDAKGARLQPVMTRKQTWRVDTKGMDRIKAEFDYRADILALNQAKIANDYAFFTGIELFLMAEGHRDRPSTVRFQVPGGWKIVSALKETAEPNTFTAADYDTLVDAPTEMGRFDLLPFDVAGHPHYLVMTPAGAFAKDKAERFSDMIRKVAIAEAAIFGEIPYEKYVHFYFFSRPESNAGGALEHLNSFVAFAYSNEPDYLIGTAAHEFFHLWNVKRLRPAEMWPYDYSRENETPLLWVSEGFTNYYSNVAQLRTGLRNREQFLQAAAQAISGVESNEARHYVSPANSSASTWLGYDTPVAFGISYYTQGQNLGALLDLSIIHDTAGAVGLDEVMRALYNEHYKRGKGFTTEDMISTINRLTKRDYHDFYKRYVWGVEVPPYDEIFGYAGYQAGRSSQQTPRLDFEATATPEGDIQLTRVRPGTTAAAAGLQAGDVLVSFDGVEARRGFTAAYQLLSQRVGKPVKVTIRRGGESKTVEMMVAADEQAAYRLAEVSNPTPQQLKVRDRWLTAGK
ncbi:MAG TPA: PDZ domain-containing protein [Blastocatellia bacterium]|nr:PDZ domain-containing protein [Blastocatellia bacterium]